MCETKQSEIKNMESIIYIKGVTILHKCQNILSVFIISLNFMCF